MSLEYWFKVSSSLAEGNYYLFETGGDGRGHGMWLEVTAASQFILHLHIQPISDSDNASKVNLTHNITDYVLAGDYIQAAYSIEKTNSNGVATLYVNGSAEASHTGNLNEWSGGDNTGIGLRNGSASIDDESYTMSNLVGQVALINYYDSLIAESVFNQSYLYYSGTGSVLSEIDYGLSGSAKVIAGSVPLSDSDSLNFDGGSLQIQVTSGADASDVLSTSFDYSSFATLDGSGSNITFSFNDQATVAKVQSLIQSITFFSSSSETNRQVTFTVDDGDGSTPAPFKANIEILPPNNAPELTSGDYSITAITEDDLNSAGTVINAIAGLDAAISDADGGSKGVVITSLTGNGFWQYKLASGNWQNVSIETGKGLHLLLTDSVRYVPDGAQGENASFGFRAWDQSNGASTGEVNTIGPINVNSAYSSTEDSVSRAC